MLLAPAVDSCGSCGDKLDTVGSRHIVARSCDDDREHRSLKFHASPSSLDFPNTFVRKGMSQWLSLWRKPMTKPLDSTWNINNVFQIEIFLNKIFNYHEIHDANKRFKVNSKINYLTMSEGVFIHFAHWEMIRHLHHSHFSWNIDVLPVDNKQRNTSKVILQLISVPQKALRFNV